MLHYYLVPFAAAQAHQPNATAYIARPVRNATVDEHALAQRIAQRCTLTETDVLTALNALREETLRALANGDRVNLNGMVEFYPKLRGTFARYDEPRDPSRHTLIGGARPAQAFTDALSQRAQSWKRVDNPHAAPALHRVTDESTQAINATLTPGEFVNLSGDRLKFNPTHPDEGVFLIAIKSPASIPNTVSKVPAVAAPAPEHHSSDHRPTDNRASEIRLSKVCGIRPKEIFAIVPTDLPAGAYHLEVRTRTRRAQRLAVGRLDHLLTVAPRATEVSDTAA
ncbi:DUF4469 domain-containing protein [Cerasicoccus frondis]|uniref:HU family DNA-binding protein n=1 Tax=Cerasicoccus frondis TaxID=490090 RepID=UPI0028529967|nr:DUF4469 domain-containing protein [Cerasicoccus frondis]